MERTVVGNGFDIGLEGKRRIIDDRYVSGVAPGWMLALCAAVGNAGEAVEDIQMVLRALFWKP